MGSRCAKRGENHSRAYRCSLCHSKAIGVCSREMIFRSISHEGDEGNTCWYYQGTLVRKRRKGALSADDHRFVMASNVSAKSRVNFVRLYVCYIARHFHSALKRSVYAPYMRRPRDVYNIKIRKAGALIYKPCPSLFLF